MLNNIKLVDNKPVWEVIAHIVWLVSAIVLLKLSNTERRA